MAQAMYCDSDGADPAAFLITEIDTGSVSAACFPHLLGWCAGLLQAAGYTVSGPVEQDQDGGPHGQGQGLDGPADPSGDQGAPVAPVAGHRAPKAAPKHKAAKSSRGPVTREQEPEGEPSAGDSKPAQSGDVPQAGDPDLAPAGDQQD